MNRFDLNGVDAIEVDVNGVDVNQVVNQVEFM